MRNILIIFFLSNYILELINGNICDYTDNAVPICCAGFIRNVYGDCVKSECNNDCGNGRCIGINLCKCADGTLTSDTCKLPEKKSCPKDCSNRGKCQNGKCRCFSGYTGIDCSGAIKSTCYIAVQRGLCVSSLTLGMQLPLMTQEECCAVFQVAWGQPCQFCNNAIISNCGKGYRMTEKGQCQDINECGLRGMCLNGRCLNYDGYFECECPEYYTLNKTTYSCESIRSKSDNPCLRDSQLCQPNGHCFPISNGQYFCQCTAPYQPSRDRKQCVRKQKYNMCKLYHNLCLPHGRCIPNDYSYYCQCTSGYIPTSDNKACKLDKNDRMRNDKGAPNNKKLCDDPGIYRQCQGGQCINNGYSDYECSCVNGFKKASDGRSCQRDDESYTRPCDNPSIKKQCEGGQCIDKGYSDFECYCTDDYARGSDGRSCQKRRSSYNLPCDEPNIKAQCQTGRCINKGYSDYECSCNDGYERGSDGRSCQKSRTGYNLPCDTPYIKAYCEGGQCINKGYSDFECYCTDGYERASDGRSCQKKRIGYNLPCDEPNIKSQCQGGQCINRGYSDFECSCSSDYERGSDGRSCQKRTNEGNNLPCNNPSIKQQCQGGQCINRGYRDYECVCTNNYERASDGRSCQKKSDEQNKGLTDYYCTIPEYKARCRGGQCSGDRNLGFRCTCLPGFKPADDNRACYEDDSSRNNKPRQLCDDPNIYQQCKGGQCINKGDNNYECSCPSGYDKSSDGKSCEKSDSANDYYCTIAEYKERCQGGQCSGDKNLGFRCTCLTGFKPADDNRACYEDKSNNENKGETQIKGDMGFCTVPEYRDRCKEGRCVPNHDYGFQCECPSQGYQLAPDGRACHKVNTISQSLCAQYGSKCQGNPCYENNGQYQCYCQDGFEIGPNKQSCIKKKIRSLCQQYKYKCQGNPCYENNGQYQCICQDGFESGPNQQSCTKKKIRSLCQQYKNKCLGNPCYENNGQYQCICQDGFENGPNQQSCVKKTKHSLCYLYSSKCLENPCYEVDGQYKCYCSGQYDYGPNQQSCVKRIQTCADYQYHCEGGGYCYDTNEDGFMCICNPGYTLSVDKKQCLPTNDRDNEYVEGLQDSMIQIVRSHYAMVNDESSRKKRSVPETVHGQACRPECKFGCSSKYDTCACPHNYLHIYQTSYCISSKITWLYKNKPCKSKVLSTTILIQLSPQTQLVSLIQYLTNSIVPIITGPRKPLVSNEQLKPTTNESTFTIHNNIICYIKVSSRVIKCHLLCLGQ